MAKTLRQYVEDGNLMLCVFTISIFIGQLTYIGGTILNSPDLFHWIIFVVLMMFSSIGCAIVFGPFVSWLIIHIYDDMNKPK